MSFSAGHSFGPDAPETARAVETVDKLVGELWAGIQQIPLPIDSIGVSDHGMQTVTGAVNRSDFADLSQVRVIPEGSVLLIYPPNPETTEKLYAQLKGKSPKFDVYRSKETPARWHYSDSERIGDLVVYVHDENPGARQPARSRRIFQRPRTPLQEMSR